MAKKSKSTTGLDAPKSKAAKTRSRKVAAGPASKNGKTITPGKTRGKTPGTSGTPGTPDWLDTNPRHLTIKSRVDKECSNAIERLIQMLDNCDWSKFADEQSIATEIVNQSGMVPKLF